MNALMILRMSSVGMLRIKRNLIGEIFVEVIFRGLKMSLKKAY